MANTLTDWYNQKKATPAMTKTAKPTGMITAVNNWQNTPDQTVQGQTENIIRNDAPLMQLARTEADQQSQRRGLLTSSIGVGAAQDATYRAALPIAQADAQQAARVAGYNVDTLNKANEFNAANQFNRQERVANNAYDWRKTQSQNQYDFKKAQFTEGKADRRQTENLFAAMADTYNKELSNINRDPNMTQQAKDWAVYQLNTSSKTLLSVMSNIGKMSDVSKLLKPMAKPSEPASWYRNYVPASSGGGGGKIICLQWHALGLMSDDLCRLDQAYGAWLMETNPEWQKGYLRYAKHVVKRMHGKTWQSRLFIKCLSPLVMPWATQMGHIMGGDYPYSLFGDILMRLMVGFFVGMNRLRLAKIKVKKFLRGTR